MKLVFKNLKNGFSRFSLISNKKYIKLKKNEFLNLDHTKSSKCLDYYAYLNEHCVFINKTMNFKSPYKFI